MVAFNVSLDDASPLIHYSGSWSDTPANDTLATSYSAGSLHTSSAPGSTATFTFNGTGIWLYGAHRPGYGSYSVSVDGQTIVNTAAAAAVPVFDQLMGGSGNLGLGQHTVVFSNVGGGPVDLDSLTFETHIGTDDQQVNKTTMNDNDSQISYSPSTAWQVSDKPFFADGSAHYTETTGAQATLTFSGDAVAVYGGVSFDHGPFTVSLDGQAEQLNGANGREYHAQTLLYFSQALGSGPHNLVVKVGSGFLDLDSIVVYNATGGMTGTPSTTAFSVSATPGQNDPAAPSTGQVNAADGAAASTKAIPKTVIVGIVIACILGLLSILLIIVFVVHRMRRRKQVSLPEVQVHSPTFLQDPSLAGGDGLQKSSSVRRNTARFTMKSFASLWSQNSYGGQPHDVEAPPMPALPAGLPTLGVPAPPSDRPSSRSSIHTDSATLNTLADYYDDKGEEIDDHSRESIGSASTVTVAPLRPTRPPELDLSDLEHVPL